MKKELKKVVNIHHEMVLNNGRHERVNFFLYGGKRRADHIGAVYAAGYLPMTTGDDNLIGLVVEGYEFDEEESVGHNYTEKVIVFTKAEKHLMDLALGLRR